MSIGPTIGKFATMGFITFEVLSIFYIAIQLTQLSSCGKDNEQALRQCRHDVTESLLLTGEMMVFVILLYGLILFLVNLFIGTAYGDMRVLSTTATMWLITIDTFSALMSLVL